MEVLNGPLANYPIAVAVIVISVLWMKHTRFRDKEWIDAVKGINAAQVKRNEACDSTVRENTKIMGRVEKLLDVIISKLGKEL